MVEASLVGGKVTPSNYGLLQEVSLSRLGRLQFVLSECNDYLCLSINYTKNI